MNTRHAQLVLAVVREGSFTAAAKSLFVTQPTLSHHMKTLTLASIVKTRKTGAQVYYTLNGARLDELLVALGELRGGPGVK